MRSTVVALLIAFIASTTAGAVSFELPPLNSPSSTERHVGKIVWADLVTPDLASAEAFYGSLFGWTFQTIHAGKSDYALAVSGGRPVGGIYQRAIGAGERVQPAWLTFIAVSDAEATKRMALAHGAKILSDVRTYPLRGRQAVFSDPEGAVFAVLQSSSGDPSDFLASSGEWIWSALLSRDPGSEAAFYQELFSYDVFDMASEDGLDHLVLSSDDYARASVNAFSPIMPATSSTGGSPRRHPHWLNFVRVASTPDTVARAVALGGRVLVQPHVDRHGGQAAVIADPAGAPVGVMEWNDSDSKVEPK